MNYGITLNEKVDLTYSEFKDLFGQAFKKVVPSLREKEMRATFKSLTGKTPEKPESQENGDKRSSKKHKKD